MRARVSAVPDVMVGPNTEVIRACDTTSNPDAHGSGLSRTPATIAVNNPAGKRVPSDATIHTGFSAQYATAAKASEPPAHKTLSSPTASAVKIVASAHSAADASPSGAHSSLHDATNNAVHLVHHLRNQQRVRECRHDVQARQQDDLTNRPCR